VQRADENCSIENAHDILLHTVKNGFILIQTPSYMYIRHQHLVFACKRYKGGKPTEFVVATILYWDKFKKRMKKWLEPNEA
jgi:hypothetical protein